MDSAAAAASEGLARMMRKESPCMDVLYFLVQKTHFLQLGIVWYFDMYRVYARTEYTIVFFSEDFFFDL